MDIFNGNMTQNRNLWLQQWEVSISYHIWYFIIVENPNPCSIHGVWLPSWWIIIYILEYETKCNHCKSKENDIFTKKE